MYTLPPLPYAYDALEPFIDGQTMHVHHEKHHAAYANNLNAALQKHAELFDVPLETLLAGPDVIPGDIRTAVVNQGGGYANHAFFWQCMSGTRDQAIGPHAQAAFEKAFGGFEQFKQLFSDTALKHFGSGWAWLEKDAQGNLIVESLPNQNSPLASGAQPVLCLDVWEHAYYLQYQNRRQEYIDAWWHVVDWSGIEKRLEALSASAINNNYAHE